MKLRNKKTGKIVDVESLGHAESLKKNGYQVTLSWATEYENLAQCKDYNSLAELNEDWEDVGGTNATNMPLIKDEKIRKAVRAWAEACGLSSVEVYLSFFDRFLTFKSGVKVISFQVETPKELKFGEKYTITELCGEDG